ncbi:cyclic-phosphate processing receiver domain-containing protein [Comamonas sp.]|uniref:cyclic-phosphate processing receiver domain-containing protein n=1 Tax=Comamonas sp. TaxID=34028 RepID=UPI002FC636C8
MPILIIGAPSRLEALRTHGGLGLLHRCARGACASTPCSITPRRAVGTRRLAPVHSGPDEEIRLLETGAVNEIRLDHDLGNESRGTGYDMILWIEEAVALRSSNLQKSMCNPRIS